MKRRVDIVSGEPEREEIEDSNEVMIKKKKPTMLSIL